MDPSDSSNASELGSLSDSDWLDIASSKASEDADSLDGDGLDDRPLSRHSSNSHVSSTDDNAIIAWEGYVEDSGEEDNLDQPFPSFSPRLTDSPQVAPASPPPERDSAEDQRVRDGLDQSMISTLSGSRSSSFGRSSIHAVRDLRLSFPDPISSSRDTLNRSYENVDSSDLTPPSSNDRFPVQEVANNFAPPSDAGSSTIPEVLCDTDRSSINLLSSTHDLHIVLYGFDTDIKWKLVDQLLDRFSLGAGLLSSKSIELSSCTRQRELCSREDINRIHPRHVAITDTTVSSDVYSSADLPFDRPSLGIVFLPSSLGCLPAHTRYLPLIPSSPYTSDTPSAKETVRSTAQDKWEKLGVSRRRLLLNDNESSPVMEIEALLRIDPKRLALAFEPFLPGFLPAAKEERVAVFRFPGQLSSSWVLQVFFALTCALLGCVIGTSMRHSSISVPTASATSGSSWFAGSPINQSAPSIGGPTPTEMASIVPASLKDFSLTIFSPPGSLSVVESHSPQTPRPSSGTTQGDSYLRSLDIIRSTKDLIPLTFNREKALSLISNGKGKGRETVEDILYDVSLQMARSITELVDMEYIQAIAESLGREVKEILAVIEELVREIKLHGAIAWDDPINTVQAVRRHLHDKHDVARRNAKRRAREWGELGGRILGYATDIWNENKELARERALAINKRMFKSEEWLLHEKESHEAKCGPAIPMEA